MDSRAWTTALRFSSEAGRRAALVIVTLLRRYAGGVEQEAG